MNKHLSIVIILFLYSCTPKINEHFKQNRYIKNYNIHIINDSLQLYLKSPSDITYTTDKKELKKVIRKTNFELIDSVLIYGKTNEPPYEYFVTISKNNLHKYPKNLIVFDTLINNKTFKFIGNSLSENSKKTLKIDLYKIFKSIEVGTNYRKHINTVFDVVEKYQNSNKFFSALNEIRDFPTYDKDEEWSKLQMELTFSSFLGKNEFYENAINKLESKFKPKDSIVKIINENVKLNSDAINTIVEEAKHRKIVMINENHFYPNHRILISDLLPKFKEIGFNYLALEALNSKQDSILNLTNAIPSLETGFYTSEQNFSNLIRKAKELGFQFVAYENIDENKERELGQAENLYNKTFNIDSLSKVLVLAGIDHILEKQTSSGKQWMASIFNKKYNIDPLTISQTHLNAYRKQIQSNYGIIKSDVFNNDRLTSIDYLVLNNAEVTTENNTTVTYKNNENFDVQILLFYENEIVNNLDYLKKIPYFTTIIKAGKKIELPINKENKIYLYTFDENGNQINNHIILPNSIKK